MRIILLNAPPRAGKNTAAQIISGLVPECAVIGFSHHLKRMVHGIYLGAEGFPMDPDAFDAVKNEPQEILGGMSWRQAYIHYSENVIKPLHGADWFGRMFLRTAHNSGKSLIAVPDSGFREEAGRCVREVGASNVTLVRIHKQGCTYDGDSRSYISLSDLGVAEYDIENFHNRHHLLCNALGRILIASMAGRAA